MTTTTGPKPHPVYVKAAADPWIDTADTARLIRDRLAVAFPGVRFYVRLNRYSGGSSIDVWYDGVVLDDRGFPVAVQVDYDGRPIGDPVSDRDIDPTLRYGHLTRPGMPSKRDVDAVVAPYAGGGFDGMIDMAYSVRSWLNPDGSASFGRSSGTVGSHGSDPAYSFDRPSVGAVMVRFGADHVFVNDALPFDIARKRRSS